MAVETTLLPKICSLPRDRSSSWRASSSQLHGLTTQAATLKLRPCQRKAVGVSTFQRLLRSFLKRAATLSPLPAVAPTETWT